MNILVITATYPPSANGVAVSTKRTVSALRTLGHRVVVIGPRHPHGNIDDDYVALPTAWIPVFGLRDYPIPLPQSLPIVLRRVPRLRWDIVHVHHPIIAGPYAQTIARALHVPVVFTYHTQYDVAMEHIALLPSWITRWYYERTIVETLKKFSGIIATTKWLQEALEKKIPDVPIYYVSTAGLPKPFRVDATKQELRSRLGIRRRGPIFLSVSRLSPEKRTDILIAGFLAWAAKHPEGDLVIVGDGGHRAHLEHIVAKSTFAHRVQFIGKIPNEQLPSWYSAADIFLYSSITDTIGINILEAMSAGLPVVAPDHKTSREVIVDGKNGRLYKGPPARMAQAIHSALRIQKRLSAGALVTSRLYALSRTTKSLCRVYESIRQQYHH